MKNFFSLVILFSCTLASAEPKQAIICKKAENFDEVVAMVNGLLVDPNSETTVNFIRENKTKGSISVSIKNFMYDTAHTQYFETKEQITEGTGKNKKTREATMYNACVPVQLN